MDPVIPSSRIICERYSTGSWLVVLANQLTSSEVIRLKVIIVAREWLSTMATTSVLPWESLEQWSAPAFLVAGILFLGYATFKGIELFTSMTTPSALDVTVGTLGLLIPVVALLGLYPRLRGRMPRLSLAGVVVILVSAVGSVGILGWLLGTTLLTTGYPAIPEEAPAWTVVALLVTLVTIAMGFLLFSIASLRTDAISRTVSCLLVVPSIMWIGLLVAHAMALSGPSLGIVVYVPISVALLAVGYRLRTGAASTDRAEPTVDLTAR